MLDVICAHITSPVEFTVELEIMIAGRSFEPVKSEKGKSTKTISPLIKE
jgi:hypothetical protein